MTERLTPQEEQIIAHEAVTAEIARVLIEDALTIARELPGYEHVEKGDDLSRKVFDRVDLPSQDGEYTGGIYITSSQLGSNTTLSRQLLVHQMTHADDGKLLLRSGVVYLATARYSLKGQKVDSGLYSYRESPGLQFDDSDPQAEAGIRDLLNSLAPSV